MMEGFDPTQPSEGLGDTIAKITHYTGISELTEVVTGALGIEDCGCNGRRESLNSSKPYKVQPNSPPPFNPNDHPKSEIGVYEVKHQISVTKGGQKFNFSPGDKILMNETHLLYSDWPYYTIIGAAIKTN